MTNERHRQVKKERFFEADYIANQDHALLSEDGICPRCGTPLRVNYSEQTCLQCGYENYAFRAIPEPKRWVPGFSNLLRVRYIGDSPACQDMLALVTLVDGPRGKNAVRSAGLRVRCPFKGCGEMMSRTRHDVPWRCRHRHFITLVLEDDIIGWK